MYGEHGDPAKELGRRFRGNTLNREATVHGGRSDPFGELKRAYEGYKPYKVLGAHYENIGNVDDLFEDERGRLLYIGTKMGLLAMKSTLIPTEIIRVNDKRGIVQVSESEDQIRHAPSLEDHEELTPELEDRVHGYFGLIDKRYGVPPREPPIRDEFAPDGRIDVEPGERERGVSHEHPPEQKEPDRRRSIFADEIRVQHPEELGAIVREWETGSEKDQKRVRLDHEQVQVPKQREEATTDHAQDVEHARDDTEGVEDGPEATEAAERRARELGVDLSTVEGTGAGSRILVKDVDAEWQDRIEATEAAERKARALGVDLSAVEGSGSGGRILVKDVESEWHNRQEVTEAAEHKARRLGVDLSTVKGTGSGGRILVGDVEAEGRKSAQGTQVAANQAAGRARDDSQPAGESDNEATEGVGEGAGGAVENTNGAVEDVGSGAESAAKAVGEDADQVAGRIVGDASQAVGEAGEGPAPHEVGQSADQAAGEVGQGTDQAAQGAGAAVG